MLGHYLLDTICLSKLIQSRGYLQATFIYYGVVSWEIKKLAPVLLYPSNVTQGSAPFHLWEKEYFETLITH